MTVTNAYESRHCGKCGARIEIGVIFNLLPYRGDPEENLWRCYPKCGRIRKSRVQFLNILKGKARRPYTCELCVGPIKKGDEYISRQRKIWGRPGTCLRYHVQCWETKEIPSCPKPSPPS